MGASRDFSTGSVTGSQAATALLDRDQRGSASTRSAPRSFERQDTPLPPRRKPHQNRLGSRQVVSVRGRRVATTKQKTLLAKLSGAAALLIVTGVALAMWLSGVSTQQTFHAQQLVSQDRQLSNQLETLNRDLENVRSSAEIARRAGEMGMAVPTQPGILTVENNGDIIEERAADLAVNPIIDVNGAPVRPGKASSDPDAIDELGDNLEAVPEGHRLAESDATGGNRMAESGIAPYAPNVPPAAEARGPEVEEDNVQMGESGQ